MSQEHMSQDEPNFKMTKLSDADAKALDKVLEDTLAGGEAKLGLSDAGDERYERAQSWLKLIGQDPAEQATNDLAGRTMKAIAQAKARDEEVLGHVQQLTGGRGGGFRWTEVIAVAAMLAISVSLLWPLLSQQRNSASRLACQNNIQAAGLGFSSYAKDSGGFLPRYVSTPGKEWWEVGKGIKQEQGQTHALSNSANLMLPVRKSYISLASLACPSNPYADREGQLAPNATDFTNYATVSYSLQNRFTSFDTKLEDKPRMVILADRNPLLLRFYKGNAFVKQVSIQAASDLHGGIGQNVLFADGSVKFIKTPAVESDDNIWLPKHVKSIENLKLNDSPQVAGDSMVVP